MSEDIKEALLGIFQVDTSALEEALANLPEPSIPAETAPLEKGNTPLPKGAPPVLALVGYLRSGKDVVASYIETTYRDVERMAYSDPIIAECNRFLKPWGHTIGESNKSSYRLLLQSWSMVRRQEDPGYWSNILRVEINQARSEGKMVVLSGARLPADVELVREYGGELWRVVRPGGERTDHPNEAWIDQIECSRTIWNSVEGDTGLLLEQIKEALHS